MSLCRQRRRGTCKTHLAITRSCMSNTVRGRSYQRGRSRQPTGDRDPLKAALCETTMRRVLATRAHLLLRCKSPQLAHHVNPEIDRHGRYQRVDGPPCDIGKAAPRGVMQNRRASEIYRLEHAAGGGIIGARRKNGAHLHRPWRANLRWSTPRYPARHHVHAESRQQPHDHAWVSTAR